MKRGADFQVLLNYYSDFLKLLEKILPFLAVGFFVLGILLASHSEGFARGIERIMSGMISYYGYFAPVAIYLILTPSLTKILIHNNKQEKKFISYAVGWLSLRRVLACVWAVVFTTLVFGLPLYINGGISFQEAVLKTVKPLGWMLLHSPYFYALYLSIFTVILSTRVKKISYLFETIAGQIENLGKHFILLIPLFMLAIGAYVYYLPTSLAVQIQENLNPGTVMPHLNTLSVFGYKIHAATAKGMVLAYLAGAFLTGLACLIWHFALLLFAKYHVKDFSIKKYFRDYWCKVYPLLWATSSEALATPLNLHLIKTHYPKIKSKIRLFVMGTGSFLNINGTLICVFLLAGLVAGLMGIKISFLQLFLAIPLICLLGYGVPGIPGELLLFAGPIAALLGLPDSIIPVFLALYLGLQIGLPDSFRTGNNSTDNAVCCILLDKIYKEKFETKEKEVPETIEILPSFVPAEQLALETVVTSDDQIDPQVQNNQENVARSVSTEEKNNLT